MEKRVRASVQQSNDDQVPPPTRISRVKHATYTLMPRILTYLQFKICLLFFNYFSMCPPHTLSACTVQYCTVLQNTVYGISHVCMYRDLLSIT